jgi:ribonuclease PH
MAQRPKRIIGDARHWRQDDRRPQTKIADLDGMELSRLRRADLLRGFGFSDGRHGRSLAERVRTTTGCVAESSGREGVERSRRSYRSIEPVCEPFCLPFATTARFKAGESTKKAGRRRTASNRQSSFWKTRE